MKIKDNIVAINAFMWIALVLVIVYQIFLNFKGYPAFFLPDYALPLVSSAFYMLGANFFLVNHRFKNKLTAFFMILILTLIESSVIFMILMGIVMTNSKSFHLALVFLFIAPAILLVITSKFTVNFYLFKEHFVGNLIGLIWATGVLLLWLQDPNGERWIPLNDLPLVILSAILLIPSGLPHSYLVCKKLKSYL